MAALKFKISGDASQLQGTLGKAGMGLKRLAAAGAKMGLAAAFTGAAAAAAGLAGSIAGIKRVLDMGGTMSDVAANTGLMAGEVMVLTRAFQDAGIGGDKVQGTINKMQKSIVEAGQGLQTPIRALESMGLAMDDLTGKSPAEQFAMISGALAGMADPTERAAAAMQLFGRAGGEMGALVSNPEALTDAAASVGSAAGIMNENADAFDKSADLLAGMGAKLDGLFIGMAEFINPILLPLLEKLNSMDLAKYGQAVGRFAAMVATAFSSGEISGIIGNSLMVAGKSFINLLVGHIRGLVAGIWEWIKNWPSVFVNGFKALIDPNFWAGLGKILLGIGQQMGLALLGMIPDALLRAAGMSRDAVSAAGVEARGGIAAGARQAAGALEGYTGAIETGAKNFAKAYMREMENSNVMDTAEERGKITDAVARIAAAAKAQRAAAEAERAKAGGAKAPGLEKKAEKVVAKAPQGPLISTLAAVGGSAAMLRSGQTMDRERNSLLKMIERNTAKKQGPLVAGFA